MRRTEGERQAGMYRCSYGIEQQANDRKGRFELFLDLLYVALLANFAEHLAAHPTGKGLVLYIVGTQNHARIKFLD